MSGKLLSSCPGSWSAKRQRKAGTLRKRVKLWDKSYRDVLADKYVAQGVCVLERMR